MSANRISNISDSYNVGNVISSGNKKGSIVGSNENVNNIISNCYYLSTIGIGGVSGADTEGTISKTKSEFLSNSMTQLLNINSSYFKNDTKNINNGYPILLWQ